MNLKKLIKNLDYYVLQGSTDLDVSDIYFDTRKVKEQGIFVCLRGETKDGHDYVKEALLKGALVLIVEDLSKTIEIYDHEVTILLVEDTKDALAKISAEYFQNPSKNLLTIGITGTKGKTTTAYMVKSVLERYGCQTGLIGTVEIITGKSTLNSENTTPMSYDIQKYMAEMVEAGYQAVVLEVSSLGLKHKRCNEIDFTIAAFTNLTKDHVGEKEHASFDEYIACKKLFVDMCKVGIFNIDDRYMESFWKESPHKKRSFGIQKEADYMGNHIKQYRENSIYGMMYRLEEKTEDFFEKEEAIIRLSLPGMFNVYNSLCAYAIARELKIPNQIILQGIEQCKIKGRCEWIHVSDKFRVLLDYAHNAISLESILTTLLDYKPERLVCIFGCGGDRSKDRRFEMGEVSGRLADYTIITSDNPRNEEAESIISDIEVGIKKTEGLYLVKTDRKEAIKYAISNALEGDLIVIAGKGHEIYQEIKNVKYHMDDRELILEA